MVPSYVNFKNNKVAVVYIDTNGKDPKAHEVTSFTVLPLNNFAPDPDILPFTVEICPEKQGNLSIGKYIHLQKYGLNKYDVIDLFDAWFRKFKFQPTRRFMALAWDWPFVRSFLQEWFMSVDDLPVFYDYFSHKFRDILCITQFLNDVAENNSYPPPFLQANPWEMMNRLGVQHKNNVTPLDRAFSILEAYNKLASMHLPGGIDIQIPYPDAVNYEPDLALET